MRRSKGLLIWAAFAALLLAGLPAGAEDELEPHVTDPAGDANAVNYQGLRGIAQHPLLDDVSQQDTRPVNIDSADLLAIRFETTFDEDLVEEDGEVVEVRHEATGLAIHVETLAPAAPSFGPTVVFRVPATVGGCNLFFQAWVAGPASAPGDTPQRADIRTLDEGCAGGEGVVFEGAELTVEDTVMTLRYPFDAPVAEGLLGDGAFMIANGDAHVRPLVGVVTAPAIDEAVSEWFFTIGEDVPDDVSCDDPEADHPACPAGD